MLHILLKLPDACFEIEDILLRCKHFSVNRIIKGDVLMLGEISDRCILCNDHLSVVGRFFSHDDFEQGCFTGTVDTDDCNLLFFVDVEIHIAQNFFRSKCF